jgi:hypothetical protein
VKAVSLIIILLLVWAGYWFFSGGTSVQPRNNQRSRQIELERIADQINDAIAKDSSIIKKIVGELSRKNESNPDLVIEIRSVVISGLGGESRKGSEVWVIQRDNSGWRISPEMLEAFQIGFCPDPNDPNNIARDVVVRLRERYSVSSN